MEQINITAVRREDESFEDGEVLGRLIKYVKQLGHRAMIAIIDRDEGNSRGEYPTVEVDGGRGRLEGPHEIQVAIETGMLARYIDGIAAMNHHL